MPCVAYRDKNGTVWRVPADTPKRENVGKINTSPAVDVWWSRPATRRMDETLIIHQENGERADVVMLTLGQAFDLLHAVGLAIKGA